MLHNPIFRRIDFGNDPRVKGQSNDRNLLPNFDKTISNGMASTFS